MEASCRWQCTTSNTKPTFCWLARRCSHTSGWTCTRNWAAGGPCLEVTVCSRIAYTDGVTDRNWKLGFTGQWALHIGRADLPGRLPWTATILISHLQCSGILQCYIHWLGFSFRFYLCGTCTERKLRQQKHAELCARIGIMPAIGIRTRHSKSATLLVNVDNSSIHAMKMHTGAVDLRLHSFLNFGSGSGQHHSPAAWLPGEKLGTEFYVFLHRAF